MGHLLEHVVERDVVAVPQPLQLVAHVLEEHPVPVEVDLQPALEQAQDELDLPYRYHAPLVDVDDVPRVLEVPDVGVREQRVFLARVEKREVLHDDGLERERKGRGNFNKTENDFFPLRI